jgi:hypothetical protein
MALLATNAITVAGTVETLAAASAGGDTIKPDVGAFLAVKNADASSKTVTLVTPGTLPTGDAYPDKVYTVANGTTQYIPVPPAIYRDPTTGLCAITYSAVTSVTVGMFQV